MTLREDILNYVKEQYNSEPEHLWLQYPDYVVFRHSDNRKWFGLIMNIPREKLGLPGAEYVDILNVKLGDPLLADLLTQREGFFWGYHISRGSWVSILLDGTVPLEEICGWIDTGYRVTAPKPKKQARRPAKEPADEDGSF